MCKIMAFTNISKLGQDKLRRLLHAINPEITYSDKDGFGWAAYSNNKLFGERYVNPADFDFRLANRSLRVELPITKKLPISSFGTYEQATGPLIVNGRTSTNAKNLLNTHPFVKSNFALIHNGVVQNHGQEYKTLSSSDSELILNTFVRNGIKGVENDISGYYACAVIDPKGRLHIFKDSIANLHVAYCKTIDSLVFATTKTLIENVALEMNWKIGPIDPVLDDIYLVFKKNEVLYQQEIHPKKFTMVYDSTAKRSLGDDWQDWGDTMSSQTVLPAPSTEELMDLSDSTHDIFTESGLKVTCDEFYKMDGKYQLECTIIRKNDGSWLQAGSKQKMSA